MYKPVEPIRCPKCGAIVKVDLYKILTSYPPCYEWTCPNCGEKGNTRQGDVITFENQIGRETSGTNPKSTACNIPAPQFIQQGWQCPKCGAILAPHQHYCLFCSKKESDWITTIGTGTQPLYGKWTNEDNLTPPSGQYINPNPSISISNLTATTSDPNQNISVKAKVK